MLWAGSLVLAAVTSALPAPSLLPMASTYDEAACADALDDVAKPAQPLLEGVACSEPPAPAPALIDCNDPGMSQWVGEMIGSCDMPKPTPPGVGQPVLRAAHDGVPARMCDGFRCSHDSSPMRSAARPISDGSLIALQQLDLSIVLTSSLLPGSRDLRPAQALLPRVERPPRAA